MTQEAALRATEVLLALAFIQQSLEHLAGPRDERRLFAVRLGLSVCLLLGVYSPFILLALAGHALAVLVRFRGPYNGGSDRMGLLVVLCLSAATWAPAGTPKDLALGYLAVQLVLSYVISGQVKIVNADWRNGQALVNVFRFSAYPVSGELRGLANRPRLMLFSAWGVMGFELLFPLALLHQNTLYAALAAGTLFHLANACLFGLNRFLWIWLAAYPSLLWLQVRLF